MNERASQPAAQCRQCAKQQGRHQTMDNAQPRQRHRDAIQFASPDDAAGQYLLLLGSL